MFTVIFLSHRARSIFDSARTFFEPFELAGDIAFCDWNEDPEALTLAQAAPSLPKLIQGKREWRAIVVDHSAGLSDRDRNTENPFDYLANARYELNLAESPYPLVRLAHQLLGYPALSTKSFTPVIVYDEITGRGVDERRVTRRWAPDQLTLQPREEETAEDAAARVLAEEMPRLIASSSSEHRISGARVEYEGVPYSPESIEEHRRLHQMYELKEVHPTEVAFVCTRTPISEDEQTHLQRLWHTHAEGSSSRFVERNDYPVGSRFAVYDLLNEENSGWAQDVLKFWTAVLTIAINQLPPSSFQADRVYALDVLLDDARLGEMLNEQMSTLTALRTRLDGLVVRADPLPEIDARSLLTEERIPVEFGRLGGGEIQVSAEGYGLTTDVPRNEASFWHHDFDRARAQAQGFVRQPRRVLARAVFDARAKARAFLDDEQVLSDIEREEVEDELRSRVRGLTTPATTAILDRRRLNELLHETDRRVSQHISTRMRAGTAVAASAIILVVWMAALAPYLIQAAAKGVAPFAWSVFTAAVVIVVLALVATASLFWMRSRLTALLRDANLALRAFVNQVVSGAEEFAAFLTDLVTYMRARSVLLGSGRRQEHDRARRRAWTALRNDADRTIAEDREILNAIGIAPDIRRVNILTRDLTSLTRREMRGFFLFSRARRTVPLNDSGEFVRAPYEFVAGVQLERVRLMEPDARRSDVAGGEPS